MKVLVTGGAGFIGRWLLREIPSSAHVVVVDRLEADVHGPDASFPPDVAMRAECVHADLRDVDAWRVHGETADVVIHLAALTGTGQSGAQLARYVEHNVTATARLLDAVLARTRRPVRLVLASSRAVYGEGAYLDGATRVFPPPRVLEELRSGRFEAVRHRGSPLVHVGSRAGDAVQPVSMYGLSKAWQEQLWTLASASGRASAVTLRLQNVYGPMQALRNPYTGILGVFTQQIMAGRTIELFEDGAMRRDFVHVVDVARAIWRCAVAASVPPVVDVGSGVPTTVRGLVEAIGVATGRVPDIVCRGRFRLGDVRHALADMASPPDVLAPWEPRPLSMGLIDYVSWVAAQGHSLSDVYEREVSAGVDCPDLAADTPGGTP